jgi:hypothetical protein
MQHYWVNLVRVITAPFADPKVDWMISAGYFAAKIVEVPVRHLRGGSLQLTNLQMLLLQSFSGKLYFHPLKQTLGDSPLPDCFVFDAKMRFAAASVG